MAEQYNDSINRDELHEQDLQRLRGLRPMDDDFMRVLYKNDIPLAQMTLRIITGIDDLVITKEETQYDLKRLVGARSICLDVYGEDSNNKKYDLEIQRADAGARPHRARYHSSAMDVENLDKGQEFEELPDTYTIFITEKDFFGKGEPIYIIDRVNITSDEKFDDGQHIIYVNGEYEGDSDIGKLMHDFRCTNAADMNYDLLAKKTRYYKEDPKGVSEMCKAMEDMRKDQAIDIAKSLIALGKITLEEIANVTKLPITEIKKLAEPKMQ